MRSAELAAPPSTRTGRCREPCPSAPSTRSTQVRHARPTQTFQQMLTVVCVQVGCSYFKVPSHLFWQARVELPEQRLGFVYPSQLPKRRKKRADRDVVSTCANSHLSIVQRLVVILLKIIG